MSMIRRNSWMLFVLIGLLLVLFAYDNIVVLPTMDPADPDRGWAWLTRDPDVLAYIQAWFRAFGVWVLAVAAFVLLIALTGFRRRERWAFITMLVLPVHLLALIVVWPWLAPLLGAILLIVVIGLAVPFRDFFPKAAGDR